MPTTKRMCVKVELPLPEPRYSRDAVNRSVPVSKRRDANLFDANGRTFAYVLAVVVSAAAIGFTVWTPLLHPRPWLLPAGAIALSAWLGGFGPALLSTGLTFVAMNLFLSRIQTWGPPQVGMSLVFLGVGLLMASAARAMARSQREAWQQSQQLQAMFGQAAVGIARVTLDGRFVRVNQRLATIAGRTSEALLGTRCGDLLHRDDATKLHTALEEIANGNRTEFARISAANAPME